MLVKTSVGEATHFLREKKRLEIHFHGPVKRKFMISNNPFPECDAQVGRVLGSGDATLGMT